MFIKIVIATLFCLGAASMTQEAVKLADFVTPCSLKDPKLNDCLTTQGRVLLPHLVAGVDDWDFKPLNPLVIPKMQLLKSSGGAIDLDWTITNAKNYGYKDMVIKQIMLNPKTFEMQADVQFRRYFIIGDNKIKGRILLLPIVGSGPINITIANIGIQVTMKTKLEERRGNMYIHIVELKTALHPEKIILKMDNLFNNKQLSDTMNKVLNDNDLVVFKELQPYSEKVFADMVLSLISRIFDKIPLKEMFTDVA